MSEAKSTARLVFERAVGAGQLAGIAQTVGAVAAQRYAGYELRAEGGILDGYLRSLPDDQQPLFSLPAYEAVKFIICEAWLQHLALCHWFLGLNLCLNPMMQEAIREEPLSKHFRHLHGIAPQPVAFNSFDWPYFKAITDQSETAIVPPGLGQHPFYHGVYPRDVAERIAWGLLDNPRSTMALEGKLILHCGDADALKRGLAGESVGKRELNRIRRLTNFTEGVRLGLSDSQIVDLWKQDGLTNPESTEGERQVKRMRAELETKYGAGQPKLRQGEKRPRNRK